MRRKVMALMAVAVIGFGWPSVASAVGQGPVADKEVARVGPLDGLASNFLRAFDGAALGFHVSAVLMTRLMVSAGTDYRVYDYFSRRPVWGYAAYPSVFMGVVGPVTLVAGLHLAGRAANDPETLVAAYATFQAAALMLGYVTVLKLITGRPPPEAGSPPSPAADERELSRTFRLGLYRGGVISGWPSGHVAVTAAMLAALVGYYPDRVWPKVVFGAVTVAMMVAVSSFERGTMHWASDAVAGALMATPVGFSTGRGFRSRIAGSAVKSTGVGWSVAPFAPLDRRPGTAAVLGLGIARPF